MVRLRKNRLRRQMRNFEEAQYEGAEAIERLLPSLSRMNEQGSKLSYTPNLQRGASAEGEIWEVFPNLWQHFSS